MPNDFDSLLENVKKRFEELELSDSYPIRNIPKSLLPVVKAPNDKRSGIYVFYDGDNPIYVGRSRNLRQRIQQHQRRSHNQASLAVLMVREDKKIEARYKPGEDRASLFEKGGPYYKPFKDAIDYIKSLEVKLLILEDSIEGDYIQAILEIYAAIELKTKYNKFRTS